jgi:hypothetical protein
MLGLRCLTISIVPVALAHFILMRRSHRKRGKENREHGNKISRCRGWDLVERSERCAGVPKVTGLSPSGGSDLLLTSRGIST